MTDRELLEKAAKAAGIRNDGEGPRVDDEQGFFLRDWNPLEDDGDALRLAVKLRITVRLEDPAASPAAPAAPADDWRKYATEREDTAQQVIERHRGEQDALLTLLANERRTTASLRRALSALLEKSSGEHWPVEHEMARTALDSEPFAIPAALKASQPAPAVPEPAAMVEPEHMAASLFEAIKHGDETHRDWLRAQALVWARSYLAATPAPVEPAAMVEPSIEKLLEWAVEDGVIRLSKVFDPDLQDALAAFAKRFAAPAPVERAHGITGGE